MKPCFTAQCVTFAMLLSLVCGCAGLGKRLNEPRISLTRIRVQEVGLLESVLHITLRVVNPNDVALSLKGADCELSLKGQSVAHGVTNEAISIPALGSKQLTVEAYTSMVGITRTVLSTLRQSEPERQMAYSLEGRLHLGGRSFINTLPFSMEGKLSAADLIAPK